MNTCEKHQVQFVHWCPECSNEMRRGALPHRTDFSTWDRKLLEQFARDAADENAELRESVKAMLNAWRGTVTNAKA